MTPVKVCIDDSETDLLTTIIEVNVEIEITAGHAAGAQLSCTAAYHDTSSCHDCCYQTSHAELQLSDQTSWSQLLQTSHAAVTFAAVTIDKNY